MPIGLEIYDAQGRVLVGVNSSVLRITQQIDYQTYQRVCNNNTNALPTIFIASAYVDLDSQNDVFISQGEQIFEQWYKYADVILVGQINATHS